MNLTTSFASPLIIITFFLKRPSQNDNKKNQKKTEKYLNFTKFFWNKLFKPWRHNLKSLNRRKTIVWFSEILKRALNNEAKLRKWHNIVKYEKKRKPEQKEISWRLLLLFFFRNLIRKSKQPSAIYRYQLYRITCLSIVGHWNL